MNQSKFHAITMGKKYGLPCLHKSVSNIRHFVSLRLIKQRSGAVNT
jgi:hypothetical protein